MSWIDDYLTYTASQESPEVFHRWVGLSIIASVLNRRCWLDRRSPEGTVYFTSYPGQLSVCLVAGAGRCKKSTAVNLAKPFMKEAGVVVFDGKITPERLLGKLGSMASGRPVLTVIASELSTFLSKSSYNDGMIENLIKLLDCESNPYETQTKTIDLVNPCLTLLMATTPFSMGKAISTAAHDTGFLSRHIFVYSEKPGAAQPLSTNEDEIDPALRERTLRLRQTLTARLRQFSSLSGGFRWSREAQRWFDHYYATYRDSPASEGEGYPQRRPVHLTYVAMNLQVAESGDLLMTERAFRFADEWLTEIEASLPKALAFIGQHADTDKQDRILKVFREKAFATQQKHPLIEEEELAYKVARYIPTPNELNMHLSMLTNAGILVAMKHNGTSKKFYIMSKEPY